MAAFLREQHGGRVGPGHPRGRLFQFGGSWCELGGFWGWAEFDRFADGSITGDAEFAGCGHTTGGGPGSADAGHSSVDVTERTFALAVPTIRPA